MMGMRSRDIVFSLLFRLFYQSGISEWLVFDSKQDMCDYCKEGVMDLSGLSNSLCAYL